MSSSAVVSLAMASRPIISIIANLFNELKAEHDSSAKEHSSLLELMGNFLSTGRYETFIAQAIISFLNCKEIFKLIKNLDEFVERCSSTEKLKKDLEDTIKSLRPRKQAIESGLDELSKTHVRRLLQLIAVLNDDEAKDTEEYKRDRREFKILIGSFCYEIHKINIEIKACQKELMALREKIGKEKGFLVAVVAGSAAGIAGGVGVGVGTVAAVVLLSNPIGMIVAAIGGGVVAVGGIVASSISTAIHAKRLQAVKEEEESINAQWKELWKALKDYEDTMKEHIKTLKGNGVPVADFPNA